MISPLLSWDQVSLHSLSLLSFLLIIISAGVSIAPQVSNVKCFGANDGSIRLNVSGGSGAYTYSWASLPSQTTGAVTGLGQSTQYL